MVTCNRPREVKKSINKNTHAISGERPGTLAPCKDQLVAAMDDELKRLPFGRHESSISILAQGLKIEQRSAALISRTESKTADPTEISSPGMVHLTKGKREYVRGVQIPHTNGWIYLK